MTEHFTQDNYNLLNALAAAIGIPNLYLEVEDGENEKDTLIIEYSEYITFCPENKTYITGYIVHFPGNYHEPPDDDFKQSGEYDSFEQAVQSVILHIAAEKINQTLEFHQFSSLPSDPPQSPVSGLVEESMGSFGFAGMNA